MKSIATSLLFLLGVSVSVLAQQDISKSFTGIKKIHMTTSSGDCRIEKSTDNKVKVELHYTYDKNEYEATMDQSGDRLEIREEFKERNVSGTSRWTLYVPDGLDFKYRTGSGSIEASNLTINIDITTGSGDLALTDVKGEIKTVTGSGEVEIRGFDGEVSATTGSGDMRVENGKGDVRLTCGSGDIRLMKSNAAFRATTGSGSITSTELTLAGASSFATGSGNARIQLAATPKYDLSVASGSGDSEVNFNGNPIEGEIVMTASKRHGSIVAPFEFDKTEEIDQHGNDVTIRKTAVKGNSNVKISISTGSGEAALKK